MATLPPGPRTPSVITWLRFRRAPLQVLEGHARGAPIVDVVAATGDRFLTAGSDRSLRAWSAAGSYVADPDAIRGLFTGDQSDLLAGEANSFLAPVLGNYSLLVLDGPQHLRHRRLLLPPFQGSRVADFRAVVQEVTAAEVARWRPGQRLVLRERMRDVTFEVICRAVFGVTEPARVQRLREALTAVVELSIVYAVSPALRADLGRWSPGHRFHATLRRADDLLDLLGARAHRQQVGARAALS